VTSVTGFLDGLANHGRLVVRSLMMSLKDVVRASRKGAGQRSGRKVNIEKRPPEGKQALLTRWKCSIEASGSWNQRTLVSERDARQIGKRDP
jgi:hypothetical protein